MKRNESLRYLRVSEVADQLGISDSTAWRWIRQGRLPPVEKLGPSTTRMNAMALDECLAAKREDESKAAHPVKTANATAASLASRRAKRAIATAFESE